MSADASEIHPTPLLTVKLYVPVANPDRVVLDPDPDMEPGLMIQFPAGKPVNNTLPVETEQEG